MASVRTLSPPGPVPLLDLSFLTEEEKMIIMRVLKADEELQKVEKEVQKCVIEQGRRTQKVLSEKKQCACCGKSFVEGEGATCPECKHMVCLQCRKITEGAPGFHCTTCFKAKLIELQSQDYMPILYSSCPPPSLYGSELILKSLQVLTEAKKKLTEAAPLQENKSVYFPVQEKPKENGFKRQKEKVVSPDANVTVMHRSESAESFNSLYSEPCGQDDYAIRGKLKVGVWYKRTEEQLYVRVHSAEGLKEDGTSNSYVKINLLPEKNKQTKQKTDIQTKTTKPTYNEILKYKVQQTDVSTHTLWLSMWDWDKFGRNHFLGEVRLPLCSMDLTNPTDCEYPLKEMEEELDSGYCGMLQLGLKFAPNSPSNSPKRNGANVQTIGTVHVSIKQAKDLPSVGPNGQTNGFVKCYLLPIKNYGTKKQTKIIRNSLNPEWQEDIVYNFLSLQELRSERALEVTVCSWDKDHCGTLIGCVRIGPNPDRVKDPKDWMGEEMSHWEAMLALPGEWVEQWHTLRPSTDHPGEHKRMKSSAAACQLRSQKAPSPDLAKDESTDQISPLHSKNQKNRMQSSSGSLPKKGRKGSDDIDSERIGLATLSTKGHAKSKSSSSLSGKVQKRSLVNKQLKHDDTTASVSSITLSRSRKGDYDITGDVMLSIEYKNKELMIHVKRARGLTVPHIRYRFSDPYIKTYLLPDKSKYSKRKTEIKRKTLNPVYNETLMYLVEEEEELKQRAIWLTVWNQNRFGRNNFLGELCLPLSSLNFEKSAPSWYELQDYTQTEIPPLIPIHSSSKPPVGGTTTPLRAAMESELQMKLLEEEVPASLETKMSPEAVEDELLACSQGQKLSQNEISLPSVPYMDPVEIVQCDSTGGVFYSSAHDFGFTIPEGAIPEGDSINIEVGITLTGPFDFPQGIKPVSPIVKLCVQQQPNYLFLKPVEVVLPHYFNLTGDEDSSELQIGFLKAGHALNGNQEYKFQQIAIGLSNTHFKHEYGILQTNHFCLLCIGGGVTREDTAKALFYLVGYCKIMPDPTMWKVYFCVTYFLKTCLEALRRQFPVAEDYEEICTTEFIFTNQPPSERKIEIKFPERVLSSEWILALQSADQIKATDVDFWSIDTKVLELKHAERTYPPRFQIRAYATRCVCTPILFQGTAEDIKIDLLLKPAISVNHTDASRATSMESEPELCDLMNLVAANLPNKWWDVGILLGMTVSQLDNWKKEYGGNSCQCFSVIFDTWKKRTRNCSWAAIITALQTPLVGETRLAEELKPTLGDPSRNNFLVHVHNRGEYKRNSLPFNLAREEIRHLGKHPSFEEIDIASFPGSPPYKRNAME